MKFFKYFEWPRKSGTVQKSNGDIVYTSIDTPTYSTPYDIAQSLTVKTTGRPVFLKFQSSSTSEAQTSAMGPISRMSTHDRLNFIFKIYRNGQIISKTEIDSRFEGVTSTKAIFNYPPGVYDFVDLYAPAGTNIYTFKVEGRGVSSNGYIYKVNVLGWEL